MGYALWIFAPLPLLWIAYTVAILGIFCAVAVLPKNYITLFITRLLKYGKSSEKLHRKHFAQRIVNLVEVPKSYFVHFYVFASFTCTLVAVIMFYCYLLGVDPPVFVMDALDLIASDSRVPLESSSAALLAIALLTLQAYRRLHDCVSVSVFSKSKMNIVHYLVGMTFYTMAAISILAETPEFNRNVRGSGRKDGVFQLHWYSFVGTLLYFRMSYYQHQCAVALSNMRKDSQGRVQSLDHKIPMDRLFDKVSNPHYLAEIGIYVSLNLVLGFQSRLYWLVLTFVTVNQTVAAILSHRWYLANYPNYPKNRKAIFPFLL